MSCNIHFQPDIIAARINNGSLYTSTTPAVDYWTTNLVTNSIFTALDSGTISDSTLKGSTINTGSTSGASLSATFIADTTATTAAAENVDYKRIGSIQSDSSFAINVGDIIEDASGLRPANNFDAVIDMNVYAAPDLDYDGDLVSETPVANTDTALIAHYNSCRTFFTPCNSYDLMLADSNSLVAMLFGQVSAHVEFPQMFGQMFFKLMFQRKNADQSQNVSLIKLATLT